MVVGHSTRSYLITHPRSASNLFIKVLNLDEQPNLLPCKAAGYFFQPTSILGYNLDVEGKPVTEWTKDELETMKRSYQADVGNLDAYLQQAAAQAKDVIVKEHAAYLVEPLTETCFVFGKQVENEAPWTFRPSSFRGKITRSAQNKTFLPDDFLKTFRPTFLIRHPALAFPSFLRVFTETGRLKNASTDTKVLDKWMTLHWNRKLYDFYAQNSQSSEPETTDSVDWPLLLDADDVISSPSVIRRYCTILGLELEKLKFTWQKTSEEVRNERHAIMNRLYSTIDASSEILKDKVAGDIDIDVEAEKWKAEFGESLAERMRYFVEAAMDDYDYLKARRLRPE